MFNQKSVLKQNKRKSLSDKTLTLSFGVFGLWFFGGAIYGIVFAEWPIFLPPQLDGVEILFGAFIGKKLAVCISSVLPFISGGLCFWLIFFPGRNKSEERVSQK